MLPGIFCHAYSFLDEAPHPTHILPLTGFISGNRLDCFVWEGRFFEKGSFVVLGESGRTGTVKGICGFGCSVKAIPGEFHQKIHL